MTENAPAPVVVVVPGDLHLTRSGLDNHRTALWMTDEVNRLIQPDFVQFIGDNVQDAAPEQFELFRDLADRLRVPWYALVGDHDVKDDPTATRFHRRVGEPLGSLRMKGFRFLRLNTQEARPLGLSPEQIDWFRDEVDDALAVGERVVVFQHNYPYQIWEDFTGPGIDDWRAIVQTRRIHAVITGHTHYGQVANDGRNVLVATRLIGDPEGGPPGCILLYLHEEDLAATYRTQEESGPIVLITHPRETLFCTGPAHVVRGADALRARVWADGGVEEVLGRVDGGRWFPLQLCPRTASARDWLAPLPGGLSKGSHSLTVRAVDRRGLAGEQTIEFPVDPTGRYTAVPRVRPAVSVTDFC